MLRRLATGDEWWRPLPPGVSADGLRILAAWRAGVRRRLCRPAVADLSGRARLQRARGRHHCHRHAGRHRPDDSVGWLDRQPVFRRLLLLTAAVLMAATGVGFAAVTEFWPLLVIAVVGTMNPTSGDASIFVPLEQTVLTETIEPRRRTALFARYSVIGSCATALGVLAAAFPDYAMAWTGCSRSTAMQLMFGLYAFLGLGAFLLTSLLSRTRQHSDPIIHCLRRPALRRPSAICSRAAGST
jgi:hypothetical protein